ncbi:MFS transporter [Microbacterium sp. JZ37]|uniref:MFS transporter n=1 Tax=Microbacterium sp. JZ37 TaxID=2654193 RepID=UPI002B48E6E8|nr:MFS transporter [Microbacterium sp. JZ37]WRH16095.1 MFS transporter [Microbacterium sp. JZ37]
MRRVLLLALAQCAVLGSLTAPAVVGLSVMIRDMVGADAAPTALAGVAAAGSAAAMLANPLFGWAADRSRVPGGRRTWLVAGAIAGVAACAAVAFAPDVTWLAIAWMLAQASYNACFGAINGLLSEGLAPQDRTRAAGVFSAASLIGTLPGLAAAALLPTRIVAMTLVVPCIAAAAILFVALRLRRLPGRASAEPWRLGAVAALLTRRFVAVLAVRFVLALELAAGLTFSLYLFLDRWALEDALAVRLVSLATLIGALGVVATSVLIAATPLARVDPRRLLAPALIVLALAMVGRGLATEVLHFHIATALAGCAIGAGFTSTRSIAQAALPPTESALGLGVFNVANTLAPIVAPVLASTLIAPGLLPGLPDGYAVMYVLLAVPVLSCLATLPLLSYASTGSRPMNFMRSSP